MMLLYVGDIIKNNQDKLFMVSQLGPSKIGLVSLSDGNRWSDEFLDSEGTTPGRGHFISLHTVEGSYCTLEVISVIRKGSTNTENVPCTKKEECCKLSKKTAVSNKELARVISYELCGLRINCSQKECDTLAEEVLKFINEKNGDL